MTRSCAGTGLALAVLAALSLAPPAVWPADRPRDELDAGWTGAELAERCAHLRRLDEGDAGANPLRAGLCRGFVEGIRAAGSGRRFCPPKGSCSCEWRDALDFKLELAGAAARSARELVEEVLAETWPCEGSRGAAPTQYDRAMARELFRFESAASVGDWSAIDDAVMGGESNSRLRHDPAGHAVFEGIVSLARNGGFASVRSRPLDLGVPGAAAYLLEVRGDGKRYKLNLRTDDAFDGVNYQAVFEAPAGTWTSVRLPLSAFGPTFRGRSVPGAPPLDPATLRQIGLMIADRQAGSFSLAVRSIRAE